MGHEVPFQDNSILFQPGSHRCSNCGAFITLHETLKSAGDDPDAGLCEACALAEPGSDEFV
jgi:hypothetical protein